MLHIFLRRLLFIDFNINNIKAASISSMIDSLTCRSPPSPDCRSKAHGQGAPELLCLIVAVVPFVLIAALHFDPSVLVRGLNVVAVGRGRTLVPVVVRVAYPRATPRLP